MSTALITRPLYEIEDTLLALVNSAETAPPELQLELQSKLDEYLSLEKSKTDSVAQFLAMCDAGVSARKVEADRLMAEAKSIASAKGRIEDYVLRVMQAHDRKKLEGHRNTLSIRQSEGIIITDAEKLPAEFLRTKTTVEPDKVAIKEAIKAGVDVPGADVEFRTSLQRK